MSTGLVPADRLGREDRARRAPAPVAAAVGATVAGLVLTPVGLALGVGWLVHGSTGLVMVTGLGCLLLGVAALGWGSVGLVSRASGWWRLVPGAVLVALTVLVVPATWPAVYATHPPRPALGSTTPADLGLQYRDVTFPASDGVLLSGWYVPTRTGAAVVLLHGAGGTRTSVLAQAAVLARHGYGVLLYDARGHGRSAGRAMELGWYGDQDVSGAVSLLTRTREVDPARLAVMGLSMGGEQAIGAAAGDRRVACVVAEGATGRGADDLDWLSDQYGWRGAFTETWRGWLTYRLADLLTPAEPPVSLHHAVAQAAPRPVLLVTAGSVPDERRAAAWIRAASPASVSSWDVPSAGHTGGLATAPNAWTRHVVGFLDRCLAPGTR